MKNLKKKTIAFLLSAALLTPAVHAAPMDYTDVPADAWYAEAVEYCAGTGLMGGTGNNRFSPEGTVTRGTLAAVLYRLAGSPAVSGRSAFTDTAPEAWYTGAAAWTSQSGYMNGYGDGRFGPDDPLTLEQAAAVFWRYMGSPAAEAADFTFVGEISPYAAAAVAWAGRSGLLNGWDGSFVPRDGAKRCQLAVMLRNLSSGAGSLTAVSAMDIMCQPSGAVLMEDGTLLVTDTYHKLIWKVKRGVSNVYAGSATVEDLYGQPLGGYNDALLEDSYFKNPWAIAPFLDGWAVSDADNDVVRLLHLENTETVNGHTTEDLTVTELGVMFQHPTGLAADGEGNLYVSDTFADAVRRITPEGDVTTAAGGISEPMGLCWHGGALYIAESGKNRVVKLSDGNITVIAGSGEAGYTDGPAAEAAFAAPQGIAVDADGTIYVSDTDNSAIRQVRDGEVSTLAVKDATDIYAFFPSSPTGLLIVGNRLYICDPFARKLLVYTLR